MRTEENIAAVNNSVQVNSKISIRHQSQQLRLSSSTMWNILHKDLGLRSYKNQLIQELKPRTKLSTNCKPIWLVSLNVLACQLVNKFLRSVGYRLFPMGLSEVIFL